MDDKSLDAIFYEFNFFSNIFEKTIPKKTLIDKYENLFKTYDCFARGNNVVNTTFGSISYINKNHNEKKDYNFRKNRKNDQKKTIENQLMEILNKLNLDNYRKMMYKIQKIFDNDNLEIIVRMILKQSIKQLAYQSVFLKLLFEIYSTSSRIHKKLIQKELNEFIDEYIHNQSFIMFKNKNSVNYNQFCDQQLEKEMVLSKNSINIKLISSEIVTMTFEGYLTHFVNNLNKILDDNSTSQEYYIDIIIMIFLDFLKQGKSCHCINNLNKEKLVQKIDLQSNQKLRFLIMDFLSAVQRL